MPPFKCRVLNCCNTSNDLQLRKISFFPFPEDPEIVNKWVERCGQPKAFNTKSARLCSIHFAEKDFDNDDSGARRMRTRKKVLKKECVPTLFIPDVTEINIAKQKILPKRRGRKKIIKTEKVEEAETKSVKATERKNSAGRNGSLERAKVEDFDIDSDSEFEAGPSFASSTAIATRAPTPRDDVLFDITSIPSANIMPRLPKLLQRGGSNSSKMKVKSPRKPEEIVSKSKPLENRYSASEELIHVMKTQALVNEKQAHVNETLALVSFSQAISTLPAPTATTLIEALGSPNFFENLRSAGYHSIGNLK